MRPVVTSLSVLWIAALATACGPKADVAPDQQHAAADELALSRAAWDCATAYVKKNFSAAISDTEIARLAVQNCEDPILGFERLRRLTEAAPAPDLADLLAERAASTPSPTPNEARWRAHQLRVETWRLAQKVAEDYRAAYAHAASGGGVDHRPASLPTSAPSSVPSSAPSLAPSWPR